MEHKDQFSMEACYDSVKFSVETLGENPIYLLGHYTLRAQQDVFFNKTMIAAVQKYIDDKGICWDRT